MPASVHLLHKFKPERCSIFILLSCHPGNKEPTRDLLKSVSFCPQGGWRETHPGLIWCKWPTGVRAKPASGAKGSGWNVPWVMGADATQRLEVIDKWRSVKMEKGGRGVLGHWPLQQATCLLLWLRRDHYTRYLFPIWLSWRSHVSSSSVIVSSFQKKWNAFMAKGRQLMINIVPLRVWGVLVC